MKVLLESIKVTERASDLFVKEPAMEKQNMIPPTMQRTDPAQPMKRATPSSYLCERIVVVIVLFGATHETLQLLLLLLRHKRWVKKLGRDPVCVQGAGGERAEA